MIAGEVYESAYQTGIDRRYMAWIVLGGLLSLLVGFVSPFSFYMLETAISLKITGILTTMMIVVLPIVSLTKIMGLY